MSGIAAATLIAIVTFGVPIAVVGRWLADRPWKRVTRVVTFVLFASAVWLPSAFLGALVSELLPLNWGHAGVSYVLGLGAGSALSIVLAITWLALRSRIAHA